MSAWLLSVAGISLLSVLIDVVLPNGQTNKYIKGIIAFCMVFVIISPIPALLKSDFNLDNVFSSTTVEIETEFIYQVNRTRLTYLQNQITGELEPTLPNIKVVVNGDIFETKMQIKNVFVDLTNLVINSNNQHIDIRKTVVEGVQKYIQIEEDKIVINEWESKMVW